MDYKSAKAFIESLTPRGIVPGLTAVSRLLSLLGEPQDGLNIIHIAGTNGKGSVGAFLESILHSAGKCVCRFATPAVGDHLEAFSVCGKPIDKELYANAAERVFWAVRQLEAGDIFPTSFEAETAIAFLTFSELNPDYAIIECGMGGTLDATNVIKKPAAAVITSISADHTQFLGSSIREITENKAGIIKYNAPVITVAQSDEAAAVIAKTAKRRNAPLFFTGDIKNTSYSSLKTEFDYEGERYIIKLLGAFQTQNAAAAITAARLLGIDGIYIKRGLSSAVWPYRFERIGKFILDGAHNEGAATELVKSLELYTTPQNTAFICGCFKDKDYNRIAELTAPHARSVFCITPPTPRGLESKVLARAYKMQGIDAYDSGTMTGAVHAAECGGYKDIVIFGSLSILNEARKIIKGA